MKRILELEAELTRKLANILPGGGYNEWYSRSCGGKILLGPHVTVDTTLQRIPQVLKTRIENLFCEYLCDVKFYKREVGTHTHGSNPTIFAQLTYVKLDENGKPIETKN